MTKRNDIVSRARVLRRWMPAPDMALWQMLRNRRLDGWKFRRRVPLDGRVVDFYCPVARLVVEITGAAQHRKILEARDAAFVKSGYGVVRFGSHAVLASPEDV
ncbi:MAG: DUF559 domain-containing protein, partial [Pseudomonadota bacterium]